MASAIGAQAQPVKNWGVQDGNWTWVKKDDTFYHQYVPTGKLFEASNSVKEFFTAYLLIYSAPYFFGAQAITHAVKGASLINANKEDAMGKKLLVQAGKECALAVTLGVLNWYSWIPSLILIGKVVLNPLQFRVNLNQIENFLIGEEKSTQQLAEISQIGWKNFIPSIANNSLRLSDLFGMGEVIPNKMKEE